MNNIISYLKKNKTDPDIWKHYTRLEEYNPHINDIYGRFPHYLSIHKDIFIPLVSHYLVNNGYAPTYPHNKTFAVCLTHDIDSIYRSFPMRIFHCANALRLKDEKMFQKTCQ